MLFTSVDSVDLLENRNQTKIPYVCSMFNQCHSHVPRTYIPSNKEINPHGLFDKLSVNNFTVQHRSCMIWLPKWYFIEFTKCRPIRIRFIALFCVAEHFQGQPQTQHILFQWITKALGNLSQSGPYSMPTLYLGIQQVCAGIAACRKLNTNQAASIQTEDGTKMFQKNHKISKLSNLVTIFGIAIENAFK